MNEAKDKLNKSGSSFRSEISTLEAKLQEKMKIEEELRKRVRELEQVNDDLERNERAAVSSANEWELKLNKVMERNALLENELEEKMNLEAEIQRLKDYIKGFFFFFFFLFFSFLLYLYYYVFIIVLFI